MSASFLDELNLLKDTAREWVRRNPKLGKYFGDQATDPDVEHLLEGFAFLTSRVRDKIEDDLPELTSAILERIWPDLLRPFPPVAMVKFSPTEKATTERQVIGRGARISASPAVGTASMFRTTANCTIYPLEIANLHAERTRDRSVVTLDFATLSGLALSAIKLKTLRLNFCGEERIQQTLYLWMFRHLKRVEFRPRSKERGYSIPPPEIKPAALGMEESLLEDTNPAFEGYRLLREFFCMPDKFYGIDFTNLGLFSSSSSDAEFSLIFEFSRPLPVDIKLTLANIQLYCTPLVNLFEALSEPASPDGEDARARLRPTGQQMTELEIFSVDRVVGAEDDEKLAEPDQDYPKFDSLEHAIELASDRRVVYWRHLRHPVIGSQRLAHELAFVDHASKPAMTGGRSVQAQLTCFNGDAAAGLAPGSIGINTGDVPSYVTFANITAPTQPVYPPSDGSLGWRLISNLSLNITSLNDREAFATIVSTYDYLALHNREAERRAGRRAAGLVSIATKPADRLMKGVPIRGLRTAMELKESSFASEGEMLLYATILAEFLTHYATINSFHQLEVRCVESRETIVFPAKPGRQPLI